MSLFLILINVVFEAGLLLWILKNYIPDTPWTIYIITIGAALGGIASVYFTLIREKLPTKIGFKDGFTIWIGSALMMVIATYAIGALLGLIFIGIPSWVSDSVASSQSCKYDENCY